jgi:hypothetical protein
MPFLRGAWAMPQWRVKRMPAAYHTGSLLLLLPGTVKYSRLDSEYRRTPSTGQEQVGTYESNLSCVAGVGTIGRGNGAIV